MIRNSIYKLLAFILISFCLISCLGRDDYDSVPLSIDGFVAVYYDSSQLINDIKSEPSRRVENSSTIRRVDNYLFIVERLKGVHVFNQEDTLKDPIPVNFISIPFVQHIELDNNILFAQIAKGLLRINIADKLNPIYKGYINQRIEDVPNFPYQTLKEFPNIPKRVYFDCLEDNGKWIIAWKLESLKKPKCFVEPSI